MDLQFDFSNKAAASPMQGMNVLSVSDLTKCITAVIEAEDLFHDIWVRGEVSNLTKHSSGHVYYCLKDAGALIRCVMWSRNAKSLKFNLTEGMNVISRGRLSVYDKQGQYQLNSIEIIPDGVGALYIAFEQLKARLQEEGLFDASRKREIPQFPKRIAIVTSPTAAALRDMVTIARRRMPSIHLLLVPALMQGDGSGASVVAALRNTESIPDIDVIVLGRGGGSIEDLWTFNGEDVVRAIDSCRTPVVSAIGHETDFTLSDLVADLRAPTPSAAMEMILPDCSDLSGRMSGLVEAMRIAIESSMIRKRSRLEMLTNSSCMKRPERMVDERAQSLDTLEDRLVSSFKAALAGSERRLGENAAKLESLSPLGVLSRGYGIVRRTSDGGVIRSISDARVGESTEILVSDGRLISEVTSIEEGWERNENGR